MRARTFKREQQPGSDAGQNSDTQNKGQNPVVDREIVEKGRERNSLNGIQSSENGKQPMRDKQTGHPAEHRQQYVLREKLPNDPPTSGAESAPQHEFPVTGDSASQLQIRHVGATNQQKKCNTADERE